jgi:hypothetical protein
MNTIFGLLLDNTHAHVPDGYWHTLRDWSNEVWDRAMLKCLVISDLYSNTKGAEKGRRKVEEWHNSDSSTTGSLCESPSPSHGKPQEVQVTVLKRTQRKAASKSQGIVFVPAHQASPPSPPSPNTAPVIINFDPLRPSMTESRNPTTPRLLCTVRCYNYHGHYSTDCPEPRKPCSETHMGNQRTASVAPSSAKPQLSFSGVDYWAGCAAVRINKDQPWIQFNRAYLTEIVADLTPGPDILLGGDVERHPGPHR